MTVPQTADDGGTVVAFEPSRREPADGVHEKRWFLVSGDSVLVRENVGVSGSTGGEDMLPDNDPLGSDSPSNVHYFGNLGNVACYFRDLTGTPPVDPPSGLRFAPLRTLFDELSAAAFQAAGTALQLSIWERTTKFCGQCGGPTTPKTDEWAAVCPNCGFHQYPRISPAVIVAVVRDGRLLLAQNARFRGRHYSVIAGFVEAGETLEECVHREVREETGIEVRDLRYFGSQPWPFPHSMMVAFTAEWEAGELRIDQDELVDAGWFDPAKLPPVPGRISIARRLIDWFCENHPGVLPSRP